MKINSKIRKFQDGGMTPTPADQGVAAPAATPAPDAAASAQPGAEDPIMQLAQMAQQALQSGDGQLALSVCEGFLQLIQQMAGGAGGPEAAPQGEPVFKDGGIIVKRL